MNSISVVKTRNHVAMITAWSVNRIQLKYGNSTETASAKTAAFQVSQQRSQIVSTPRPRLVSWKGVVKRGGDESFRKLLVQVVPPARGKVQTYNWDPWSGNWNLGRWWGAYPDSCVASPPPICHLKSYQVKTWYKKHLDRGTFWNKKGLLQNFGMKAEHDFLNVHLLCIISCSSSVSSLERNRYVAWSFLRSWPVPILQQKGTMEIGTMTMDLINTVVFALLPVHKSISR